MAFRVLRKMLHAFRATPLHPQWLVLRHEKKNLIEICKKIKFSVLDIGCADKKAKKYLSPDVSYIGLDYYSTATEWYKTAPDLFGDAQNLPLKDSSVENVLILDVLEHLPDPAASVQEIYRILKPSGMLIIQVPFLYPVHDAPLDFHRWTVYGLRTLVENNGFKLVEEKQFGQPVETAFLLLNLALSKSALNMLKSLNPLVVLLLPILPVIVLLSNLLSVICNFILPQDQFMPLGQQIILVKDK